MAVFLVLSPLKVLPHLGLCSTTTLHGIESEREMVRAVPKSETQKQNSKAQPKTGTKKRNQKVKPKARSWVLPKNWRKKPPKTPKNQKTKKPDEIEEVIT